MFFLDEQLRFGTELFQLDAEPARRHERQLVPRVQ
jgi:hypothetical protein